MDDAMVAQVRRFNRLVAQRTGALEERFLQRDRPMREARTLWEIGADGCEVRALRARLALDSGHLSRLLRALEADGLVTVVPGAADRRVRVARLTARGRRERAVLDRRSDDLAGALLEPLAAAERERLVGAMAEVERLLTAAAVEIAPADPDDPDARWALGEYMAELGRRFPEGFDAGMSTVPDHSVLRPPAGVLLLARLHGLPVGCGALLLGYEIPVIKRMWIAPSARGLGLGRRLLTALEERAGGAVRLETHRVLTEAIALYRSSGYVEVAPFNDERFAHHWFEKRS